MEKLSKYLNSNFRNTRAILISCNIGHVLHMCFPLLFVILYFLTFPIFYAAPSLFIVIQFSWAAQSCPNLCDPMDCSMPGFSVHHQLQFIVTGPIHSTLTHFYLLSLAPYSVLPHLYSSFSSVQPLSGVRIFATPWTAACQASLSIINSWGLPKLMSIELVMPSNQPILCRPLLLLPPIPPSIRVFSNESTLSMR